MRTTLRAKGEKEKRNGVASSAGRRGAQSGKKSTRRQASVKPRQQMWLHELALLYTFTCFPSVVASLYRYFEGRDYEDGKAYLVADVSVRCDDGDGNEYTMLMIFAVPATVLLPARASLGISWRPMRMVHFGLASK